MSDAGEKASAPSGIPTKTRDPSRRRQPRSPSMSCEAVTVVITRSNERGKRPRVAGFAVGRVCQGAERETVLLLVQ
jgi:hypothetical protein